MRMSILEFGKSEAKRREESICDGTEPGGSSGAAFCQSQPHSFIFKAAALRGKTVFKNCPQIFGKQALKNWEETM